MSIRVYVVGCRRRKSFVLRWTDPQTGKAKQKQAVSRRRRDALIEAAALEAELSAVHTPWADFCERYLSQQCRGRSSRYIWGNVTRRVESLATIRRPEDITAAVIGDLVTACYAEGLTAETVRGYLKHLRAGLSWGVRQGLLAAIPPMPRVVRRRRPARARAITPDEFGRLVATAERIGQRRVIPAMQLCYLSGLRVSEVVLLSQESGTGWHLDTSHGDPVVRIAGDAQKSGRAEVLPLTPDCAEYLADGDWPATGWLLRGIPRTGDALGKLIRRVGQASGIIVNDGGKTVSAHDLRRSFGTRWASVLAPIELMRLMRHADIKTTMSYYVDAEAIELGDRIRRKVAQRVAQ